MQCRIAIFVGRASAGLELRVIIVHGGQSSWLNLTYIRDPSEGEQRRKPYALAYALDDYIEKIVEVKI